MDLTVFLEENKYIDFSSPAIKEKIKEISNGKLTYEEKARTAYEFVRDEIPHSFDINTDVITAKASDVLIQKTGTCFAKSNLLAALLRGMNIPAGFCYQHITLADDDSYGYIVHCYNAISIYGRWIRVDARGNTNGKNAQFSLGKPMLAFPNRIGYDEFFFSGIYARPHNGTMIMLENARSLQEVRDRLTDDIDDVPDITDY